MNSGVFDANGLNRDKIFIQNIRTSGPSANSTNTINVAPQSGYEGHLLSISPSAPSSNTPYNNNIVLSSQGFPRGYVVTLQINMPGTSSQGNHGYIAVYSGDVIDGNIVFYSPSSSLAETMIVKFINNGSRWVRFDASHEASLDNYSISRIISEGHVTPILLNSGSTINSGGATVTDSGFTSSANANVTISNSTGAVRNSSFPAGITAPTRDLWNRFFSAPWAVSAQLTTQLWGATATSVLRFGMYQQWQNVNLASSLAQVGVATTSAVGFEISNTGAWNAFLYEGSSPTWYTVSLSYTQGDLGGGQGGPIHHAAISYSPNGIVEWYINKVMRLRLTGLVFNWSAFSQYPCCQISASQGATTNTTGDTRISARRVMFYQQ